VLGLFVLGSCTGSGATYTVHTVPAGLEVRGDAAVPEVVVRDGERVVQRRAASDSDTVFLPVSPGRGQRWTVQVGSEQHSVSGPSLPVSLRLAAPQGTPGVAVHPGEVVEVVGWGASRAELRVEAEAVPVDVQVGWGGTVHRQRLRVRGEPWSVVGPLEDGPLWITLDESPPFDVDLRVQSLTSQELRDTLEVAGVAMPTDPWGRPDRTRTADTLALPPAWWSALLARWGLGRVDEQAPWAHQSLTLVNRAALPVDVLVEATVEGPGAEAFRPRLRDASGLDRVVASARLPPDEPVTVSLPLYVDRDALRGRSWSRRLSVVPLGADQPVVEVTAPLLLRRASTATWLGLLLAAGTATLGWGGMLWWGRRWLARQPTSDLVTVGLFGALSYVVAGALQVVGYGVAAVLGPLAPLVTGLPDAALRACLLATLVTLLPRPGVVALATVTGALLRGLTLGSFHPVDLLYVGSSAFWLESALWGVGLTRAGAWRDRGRRTRWLLTSMAFGSANVGAVATGLCVAAALYRLYYATWYVVLLLLVPGLLYVVIGCWVAVDLAGSLRRVAT